eukprot:jgi/Mesen1/9823/ME000007S09890
METLARGTTLCLSTAAWPPQPSPLAQPGNHAAFRASLEGAGAGPASAATSAAGGETQAALHPQAAPAPAPTGPPKVSVRGLHLKAANEETILEGVSFDVLPGELFGLIGPSGSGKSTVLRALNRLWEPPRGTVFLEGRDITQEDVIRLRRRVGMVFQYPYLFEGTVADNVKYGPSLQGRHLSQKEMQSLLLRAGLDASRSFLAKASNELSGGEAQRVAIARALANGPEVLLLDEPTSSLDPTATRRVEETIVRLREEEGLTVVLVSHSMEQIGRVADRAALLLRGSVLQVGTNRELRQSELPEVSLFFMGELP